MSARSAAQEAGRTGRQGIHVSLADKMLAAVSAVEVCAVIDDHLRGDDDPVSMRVLCAWMGARIPEDGFLEEFPLENPSKLGLPGDRHWWLTASQGSITAVPLYDREHHGESVSANDLHDLWKAARKEADKRGERLKHPFGMLYKAYRKEMRGESRMIPVVRHNDPLACFKCGSEWWIPEPGLWLVCPKCRNRVPQGSGMTETVVIGLEEWLKKFGGSDE